MHISRNIRTKRLCSPLLALVMMRIGGSRMLLTIVRTFAGHALKVDDWSMLLLWFVLQTKKSDSILSDIENMLSSVNDSVFEMYLGWRLGSTVQEDLCLYSRTDQVSPTVMKRSSLPLKSPDCNRIVIVSDTHERHHCIGELPSGDIFIHAGDFLMTSSRASLSTGIRKLTEFNDWLGTVNCTTKIVISGNHDSVIETLGPAEAQQVLSNAVYLENLQVSVHGLTIWGTPVSRGRSQNRAFQSTVFAQQALVSATECSPVDILITHGPHFEYADTLRPSLHVWGHVHSYHGIREAGQKLWSRPLSCLSVNASIMDCNYNPSQFPVVMDYVKT